MSSKKNQTNLLLPRLKRLSNEESWRNTTVGMTLSVVVGSLGGLALLLLLPASSSLVTGEASWGLRFPQWLTVLALIAAVVVGIEFFAIKVSYLGGIGFIREMNRSLGDKVSTMPLGWFKSGTAGSMSRLVTQEMMSLSQAMAYMLGRLVTKISSAVVICVGSFFWDWRLGLLLLIGSPLLALFSVIGKRFTNRGKRITEPPEHRLAQRVLEFARCQGALRSCHASSNYPALTTAFDENNKASKRGLWWAAGGQVVQGVAVKVIVMSMIVIAASLAMSGDMEPLSAIVVIGIALRFTGILEEIGSAMIGVEERRQQVNFIDEVMDDKSLLEPETSEPITRPGEVSLLDVHFGYVPDTPVLQGVSFNVPAKTMCALVGPSGCGKTTIARLISRFYDVDSGEIQVGGVDVRDQRTEDLMAQLSMVFQDVYLFDDTLEANIRVGRPDATDEEVRWAADLAGVTEIINRLPNGWESRVGEGGRSLSGGERQRVSIARALLKRAPIVLLDEATSALDAENEANIVASIDELRKESTLIIIAHKLETIQSADHLVVLNEDGTIAQTGNHSELVEVEGPYRTFWEYRNKAAGWVLV